MGSSGAKGGGGLSEFAAVNERMLHPIPEGVAIDDAAVIEPLVVGHHVANCAGMPLEGLDILVVGGGPIGYALFLILRARNVRQILVSEPTAVRRQRAAELVDVTVDPRNEDVGSVCRERTGGKGVDVVFDCAGIKAGLEAAFDALTPGGMLVNVAQWEAPVSGFCPRLGRI
jgi:threonine dehydrogenase-like Zn-dependent dehydrogenase